MEAHLYGDTTRPPAARARWIAQPGAWLRERVYGMLGDDALVGRARAGDHAAFDALVARYRDRLYTMALRSLGNEREAGEALCEMVLTAFHDIASPGRSCTPRTWLHLHGLVAVLRRLHARPARFSLVRGTNTVGALTEG